MKVKSLFLAGMALFVMSCHQDKKLVLTNLLDQSRADEVIVLDRATVEASFDVPGENMVPVVKSGDDYIPSQLDDMDGDGRWDELAFIVDVQEHGEVLLTIDYVPVDAYPEFNKRTNLRLGIDQGNHTFKEVDHYFVPNDSDGFKIIA